MVLLQVIGGAVALQTLTNGAVPLYAGEQAPTLFPFEPQRSPLLCALRRQQQEWVAAPRWGACRALAPAAGVLIVICSAFCCLYLERLGMRVGVHARIWHAQGRPFPKSWHSRAQQAGSNDKLACDAQALEVVFYGLIAAMAGTFGYLFFSCGVNYGEAFKGGWAGERRMLRRAGGSARAAEPPSWQVWPPLRALSG